MMKQGQCTACGGKENTFTCDNCGAPDAKAVVLLFGVDDVPDDEDDDAVDSLDFCSMGCFLDYVKKNYIKEGN